MISSPCSSHTTVKPASSPQMLRIWPNSKRRLVRKGGAISSQPSRNVDHTTMPPGARSSGSVWLGLGAGSGLALGLEAGLGLGLGAGLGLGGRV